MMEERHTCCDKCRFFLEEPNETYGECRRHAPVVRMQIEDTATWWPVVERNDWCGEYFWRENLGRN
jgi:hypothetical protein